MNSTNRQESFEKISLPNKITITKENEKKSLHKSKKTKAIIIITLTIILLIFLILFLFFYIIYINKKDKTKENNYYNIIKATYQITSGEKIKLFNYNNIKKQDYKITLLNNDNNKNYRNLQSIIKFEFTPNVNEVISVKIQFKQSFNNFKSLFEGIPQLKKVDLTNFDMANITNMDSMFSCCTSLEEINLSGVNTQNIKSMNYLFKDCKKLKEVDMSSIDSKKIENMTSLFSGCNNISRINLSSFKNVEEDALKGINSKVDIISNEMIYNKLNKISLNALNNNINFIINNINGKTCKIGENEKCKACSSIFTGGCLLCNEGYFLPIDFPNSKICSSCNKIGHCKRCFGSSFFILCQECEEGYILENNICNKKEDHKPEEDDCIIGSEEKCLICKKEKGQKKNCDKCNKGYYLPIDSKDKTKCESCKIDNCISCIGTLNTPICNICKKGYKLFENKCEEEHVCVIGENEKCRLCNPEKNKKDECLLCNNGYFLPDNSLDRKKCHKCELEGCKRCSGTLDRQKCTECENYPFYENGEIKSCNKCKIGKEENCLSCNKVDNKCGACNEGYNLMPDGTCRLFDNSFIAVYNSTSNNISTKIMCNYHLNLQLTDFIMYVDGKIAFPTIEKFSNSNLPFITYKFNSVGLHNIKVSFKKILRNCIGWMFGWCTDLIYVKFSKTFDSSHVTSIYNMFNCDYSLQWVDLSSFNTSRVTDMTDVFWNCRKLISINLSNFNTSLVRRMEGIFDHCENLNYIDLSNFDMRRVNNTKSLFYGVPKNGIIKISNLFGEYKNLIPKNWSVIIE